MLIYMVYNKHRQCRSFIALLHIQKLPIINLYIIQYSHLVLHNPKNMNVDCRPMSTKGIEGAHHFVSTTIIIINQRII